MSVFHCGITLSGARDMFCEVKGQGRVCVANVPGTMYLGNLTGPWHQVFHRPCHVDPLLVPGLGYKTVTIMIRTGLFPYKKFSRLMGSRSDAPAFRASLEHSFAASMQVEGLRLPTLDEVLLEHKKRTGRLPADFPQPVVPVAVTTDDPKRRRLTSKGPPPRH